MKSKFKSGFTLAEIMVVLAIISIIILATTKIVQSKLSFGSRMMYYAAFSNLEKISTELIGQGCKSTNTTLCASPKTLPLKGHTTDPNIQVEGGLCDRIADTLNVVGTADCTIAAIADGTTDFSAQIPNFTVTNGMRFYNVGATSISNDDEEGGNDGNDDIEITYQTADSCRAGDIRYSNYCITQPHNAGGLDQARTYCGLLNNATDNPYNYDSGYGVFSDYYYHLPDIYVGGSDIKNMNEMYFITKAHGSTSYRFWTDNNICLVGGTYAYYVLNCNGSDCYQPSPRTYPGNIYLPVTNDFTYNTNETGIQTSCVRRLRVDPDPRNATNPASNCPPNYLPTVGYMTQAGSCYCYSYSYACTYDTSKYKARYMSFLEYIKGYDMLTGGWANARTSVTNTQCGVDKHYAVRAIGAQYREFNCANDSNTILNDYFVNQCMYQLYFLDKISNEPNFNAAHHIYIDVDGSKGNSILNEDVFMFLVYTDGTVLPAGDSKGSTDSSFFSASAKKKDGTYIVNHVAYKEAACKAGKVDTTKITDYCGTFTPVTGCTYGTSNECSVVTNKPGY